MTPLEQFRIKLLEVREQREKHLQDAFGHNLPSVIMLTLNIPGTEKTPDGAETLFHWGKQQLEKTLSTVICFEYRDNAGWFAVLSCSEPPESVKRGTIEIETSIPAARLLDIDVYNQEHRQLSRTMLGLLQRRCLICHRAAVECIRNKNHASTEIQNAVMRILAQFITSKTD